LGSAAGASTVSSAVSAGADPLWGCSGPVAAGAAAGSGRAAGAAAATGAATFAGPGAATAASEAAAGGAEGSAGDVGDSAGDVGDSAGGAASSAAVPGALDVVAVAGVVGPPAAGVGGALLVSVVFFVSAGSSATAIAPTACSDAWVAMEAGASRSGAVPPVFSSVNG
jgi:hypothetical protein